MTTIDKLFENMRNTMVCAGLDPDMAKIPQRPTLSAEDSIYDYLTLYADAVAPHICGFKAQKAFFDLHSGGHDLLKSMVGYIHNNYPHLPVILDCKVGDIENTMSAYLENIFGKLNCDGIVLNPYMGGDVFQQLKDYPDKAVCVLVKTSNPSGGIVQDQLLGNGEPVWMHVLRLSMDEWNEAGNIVPIISSVDNPDLLAKARGLIPDTTPILFAGVGAQGRDSSNITTLLNSQKSGVFVNSSRGLMYPTLKEGQGLASGIETAAIDLCESLEAHRYTSPRKQPFFLIMAGVSGVGKTTIISELKKIDPRFTYISPEVTRPLREGETDKRHVSLDELKRKESCGEYLVVNEINGVHYGTPKASITRCFEDNLFAVLDYPIDKTEVISDFVNGRAFTVYVEPPSVEELEARLRKDGRDPKGLRLSSAKAELKRYNVGEFDRAIDMRIISVEGRPAEIAKQIYKGFAAVKITKENYVRRPSPVEREFKPAKLERR